MQTHERALTYTLGAKIKYSFLKQAVIRKIFMPIYEKQGFINNDLSQNNPSADYIQRWEGK